LLSYAVFFALGLWLFIRVPRGFLPDEDPGWFIVSAQGPSGTSLGYTERVVEATERTLRQVPEVENMFSVPGFSFTGNGPNRAIIFVTLKPWDERKGEGQKLAEILQRVRGPLLYNSDA